MSGAPVVRGKAAVSACVFLAVFAFSAVAPRFDAAPLFGVSVALADDDGDDGDDGGGYGGRGGGESRPVFRSGRGARKLFGIFRQRPSVQRPSGQRSRASRRAALAAPALPTRAETEIVVTGINPAGLDALASDGFRIVARERVDLLQSEVVRLHIPPGRGLEQSLADIRLAAPAATADFNHFYRPQQAAAGSCGLDGCLVRTVINWPEAGGAACAQGVEIGLVDTAINPDHEAFAEGQVDVIALGRADASSVSGKQHGTAVAALLVGSPGSRTPGLLPGAKLVAVDAFQRSGQDDRADAYDLVRAIGLLGARNVDVINLSLSGPANGVVEKMVAASDARGILLVAAAGNKGPNAEPVYPAAYAPVLAVTAVDRDRQVYRRANRGAHIDIAAPGVNVWTAASVRGARLKTGTSFAAPFVAAAAAVLKANDQVATTEAIRSKLGSLTTDLGEPGKDPVYGWGLLDASTLCPSRH